MERHDDVPTPADWRGWWPEAIGGTSFLPDVVGSVMHRDEVAKKRTILFGDRLIEKGREQNAKRAAKARADEALCARDFLTWGDTRGVHAKFCVHGEADPCSRSYDPGPTPEDEAMYEGTGIGALYGMDGSEKFAWQLAGWNLATQEFDTPALPPTEGSTS